MLPYHRLYLLFLNRISEGWFTEMHDNNSSAVSCPILLQTPRAGNLKMVGAREVEGHKSANAFPGKGNEKWLQSGKRPPTSHMTRREEKMAKVVHIMEVEHLK